MAQCMKLYFISELLRQSKVTIVIRSNDGPTTNLISIKRFLELLFPRSHTANIIFQTNCVLNAIRLNNLKLYLGLGSIEVFDARKMYGHLREIATDKDT